MDVSPILISSHLEGVIFHETMIMVQILGIESQNVTKKTNQCWFCKLQHWLHSRSNVSPPRRQNLHLLPQTNQIGKAFYMDVSKNSGTPQSSILIGFSIINHPFRGTSIFGNTHIYLRIQAEKRFRKPLHPQWPRFPTAVRMSSAKRRRKGLQPRRPRRPGRPLILPPCSNC